MHRARSSRLGRRPPSRSPAPTTLPPSVAAREEYREARPVALMVGLACASTIAAGGDAATYRGSHVVDPVEPLGGHRPARGDQPDHRGLTRQDTYAGDLSTSLSGLQRATWRRRRPATFLASRHGRPGDAEWPGPSDVPSSARRVNDEFLPRRWGGQGEIYSIGYWDAALRSRPRLCSKTRNPDPDHRRAVDSRNSTSLAHPERAGSTTIRHRGGRRARWWVRLFATLQSFGGVS